MNKNIGFALVITLGTSGFVLAKDMPHGAHPTVSDDVIAQQQANLAINTAGKGFGPQSPRDLDLVAGSNTVQFNIAPPHTAMNLCNIHFHKNAEHKGGEFTQYAGNGDGQGHQSGFKYAGMLSNTEMTPLTHEVCPSDHGGLQSGDTIEVHYVHSTAQVVPGPTLAACLHDAIKNPQLRVEAQVYVLTNDAKALDFKMLTAHALRNGFQQAVGIPSNTGQPIQYAGSTTGPTYNEQGSPFQVTWNVRPQVAKVNISTVGEWCKGNVYKENHGHAVRNLVQNPKLLAAIQR